MKKITSILLFLLVTLTSFPQEVQLKLVANSKEITSNDYLNIQLVTNVSGDLIPSDFPGFKIVSGPNSSSQSRISIVNGRRQHVNKMSYTYGLRPIKTGNLSIKPLKIKYNGKIYKSNGLSVKVTKVKTRETPDFSKNQPVVAAITVNRKNVYQGEPVLVEYKLYVYQVNIVNYSPEYPDHDGFWKQDMKIDSPNGWEKSSEKINGYPFAVFTFKREVLYPTQYGKLKLNPFFAEATASLGIFNQKNFRLQSNAPTITVKQLPKPIPAAFNGAIGNYKMESSLSKTTVTEGDAIDLNITFSGTGNFSLLNEPELQFPGDFEVLDPELENKFKGTRKGQKGSKSFKYSILPQHAGEYEIPVLEFCYFNVAEKKYKTLQSPVYKISVTQGENSNSNSSNTESYIQSVDKKEIRKGLTDIRYLQNFNGVWKNNDLLFGSFLFYILCILPILVFLLLFFAVKKKKSERTDEERYKRKKASKQVHKVFTQAKIELDKGNTAGFYESNLKALYSYLSDKLSLPVSQLTKITIETSLQNNGISSEVISSYKNLLSSCEMARFGGTTAESEGRIYTESVELINRLERELKA